MYCTVLYYIVLCRIVLYCIVLYYIVLYCIVLHSIVLYCIVLYCIVLYSIVLCSIPVHCLLLNSTWIEDPGPASHSDCSIYFLIQHLFENLENCVPTWINKKQEKIKWEVNKIKIGKFFNMISYLQFSHLFFLFQFIYLYIFIYSLSMMYYIFSVRLFIFVCLLILICAFLISFNFLICKAWPLLQLE